MKYTIQPINLLLNYSNRLSIWNLLSDTVFMGYDKEILKNIKYQYIDHGKYIGNVEVEASELIDQLYDDMTSSFLEMKGEDYYVKELKGELCLFSHVGCIGNAYEEDYPTIEDAEKFFLDFAERNDKYIFSKEEKDI